LDRKNEVTTAFNLRPEYQTDEVTRPKLLQRRNSTKV